MLLGSSLTLPSSRVRQLEQPCEIPGTTTHRLLQSEPQRFGFTMSKEEATAKRPGSNQTNPERSTQPRLVHVVFPSNVLTLGKKQKPLPTHERCNHPWKEHDSTVPFFFTIPSIWNLHFSVLRIECCFTVIWMLNHSCCLYAAALCTLYLGALWIYFSIAVWDFLPQLTEWLSKRRDHGISWEV